MSDKAFEKQDLTNENGDNLSQDESMDEAIGNELNGDDSVSGMQHFDDKINEGDEELEKLRKDLDETKDKYLRLVAEFDNYRKRTAKERLEMSATAGKDIVQPLLEVLDDSERAAKQMETSTDINTIKEGVSLVFTKLRNVLQQKGVKPMVSIGQEFNPDLHEAITEIPAPNPEMVGKIIDEVEKGYYLNDKLIRYAKVVVGK